MAASLLDIIDIQISTSDTSRTADSSPTGFPIIADEMSFRHLPFCRTQIPVNEFIAAVRPDRELHRYVLRPRSIDMQGRPPAHRARKCVHQVRDQRLCFAGEPYSPVSYREFFLYTFINPSKRACCGEQIVSGFNIIWSNVATGFHVFLDAILPVWRLITIF